MQTEVGDIRHMSRVFARELGMIESSAGLTLTQTHILTELEKYGVLNIKKLAEMLHVDNSTMSRNVKRLIHLEMIAITTDRRDRRARMLSITDLGRERLKNANEKNNAQVEGVLNGLNYEQRLAVQKGLKLYVNALSRCRVQTTVSLRQFDKTDTLYIINLIRTVLNEFGGMKPGFELENVSADKLYDMYAAEGADFNVVMQDERLVGGGGFQHLAGGGANVCELQHMYLLSEVRGFGIGAKLLQKSLNSMKEKGYKLCYLQTLPNMDKAQDLYRKFGFKPVSPPMGDGFRTGSNYWMLKVL